MSEQEQGSSDVLVIGGGLAGLMAARALQAGGWRVVVLDKGKSVGGRLATRRIGEGQADSGAQFFTARAPRFREYVDRWLADDRIYQWSQGWSDGSAAVGPSDGHSRYAAREGMSALADYLAAGLTVETGRSVTAARVDGAGWQVSVAGEAADWRASGLVLTAPVPQALGILASGGVSLAAADQEALAFIRYAPCLCGIFRVDGHSILPGPGAIQRPGEPLSWIADNKRKGISPAETVITVHASPDYSRELWEADDSTIREALAAAVLPFLSTNSRIVETQIQRWDYALPTRLHPERTLVAANLPPLAFAGDAFNGPRIEGAFLSGLAAAEALAEVLGSA